MISERHAKILEARGFDIELMERLGIESSSRLGRDCIAIPVMQGGVRINTKYRTIAGEKRFSQEPGARQIYGYAPEEIFGKQDIEVFFPRDFIEGGHFQQVIDALLAPAGATVAVGAPVARLRTGVSSHPETPALMANDRAEKQSSVAGASRAKRERVPAPDMTAPAAS